MKKITIVLVFSMAMTMCSFVFAEDYTAIYDGTDNKVNVGNNINGINNFSTVLIKRDADNSIVYLNQAEGFFSAFTDFLLNDDAENGDYTIKLGNFTGDSKEIKFTISNQVVPLIPETEMIKLGDEPSSTADHKNYAYGVVGAKLGQYDAIKIVIGEGVNAKVGGFRLKDILGTQLELDPECKVNFSIQINNVPNAVTISQVFLATYDKVNSSYEKLWSE